MVISTQRSRQLTPAMIVLVLCTPIPVFGGSPARPAPPASPARPAPSSAPPPPPSADRCSATCPSWIGGCKEPARCPSKCKSSGGSKECNKSCAHKWLYETNKGPYKVSDGKFWCPDSVQTDVSKALQSIKNAGGSFPTQQSVLNPTGTCMPSKYGGAKPVPTKFMLHDYTNMWSGHYQMFPWVTPGVSNCSPDTPEAFIKYFEDLKAASRPLDRITENCFKVGDLKTNGIIPTEALRKAGRCKFTVDHPHRRRTRYHCANVHPFFCAKTYTQTVEIEDTIRIDKGTQSRYLTVQLAGTWSMRKATWCERNWRHLPYTCTVKKVSDRVKLVVKKCIPYAHACRDQGKSCSAIPTSVCNHLKQHISSSEGMNVKIPDLPSGSSWSGHTKISSSVDGIVTLRNVQQSLQAFIAFV